jgi:hypothetical protein
MIAAVYEESLDTSQYVIDSKPLSKEAESEIRSRLAEEWSAVAVQDSRQHTYAVLLKPTEFNLLLAAAELGMNASRYLERFGDTHRETLTLEEFLQRSRTA